MPEPTARTAQYAADFEAAQEDFIKLVESLDDEQWGRAGKNFPQRINEEDESRPVGVIAHHVAVSSPYIMERIQLMVEGKPLPKPRDFREVNAEHAAEHANASRDEVVGILRETQPRLAAAVRAIPDDQLDQTRETPAGPMSVAMRLERVLIGHMKAHKGSIEAAIS